ncbi:MAG: hypothetical protein K2N90_02370, partial [Lachnospiraceae bacterium]|nr:hypothetical protein [Lachnospiraceae bacterium]
MDNNNGVFSGRRETQEQYTQQPAPPQYGQQIPPVQPPQYGQQIPPVPPMQYGQQVPPVQPPQKPEKKPGIAGKIFGGIVLSLVIMGLFIGVQFVVAIVMMIGLAFGYAIEAPGDVSYVTRMLTETIQDGEFMTNLTVIATAVSLVVAVFFYWLLWGRKKTQQDKQYFREKVLRGKVFLMISVATVGLYFLAILIANIIGFVSPNTMEEYNKMMELALGGNVFLEMLAA